MEKSSDENRYKCPVCGYEPPQRVYPPMTAFLLWRINERLKEIFFEYEDDD